MNHHHRPPNSETHFKLFIVSAAFDHTNLLSRHRIVHNILHSELDKAHGGTVHALSMICKTPQQWDALLLQQKKSTDEKEDNDPNPQHKEQMIIQQVMGVSPKCRGGDGSLPRKY
jgi:stress-induced morphogen